MTFNSKRTSQPRFLRLDDEIWKKVKKYAKEEHRSLTNMVERMLLEWIEMAEKVR